MIIARSVAEARRALAELPRPLGFVPTMGALHAGHLSLVDVAAARCASLAASIFVNPTQFLPGEDLDQYPRDEGGDVAKLEERGVQLVFAPPAEELYPSGFATGIRVGGTLTETLEGACRPGHFDGVALVVAKLLSIVQPDVVVLGQKDAQQLAVLRRLVLDLNLPVEVVGAPIVREPDGLAMSSRNAYLSPQQRAAAPSLSAALAAGREAAQQPSATCASVIAAAERSLAESGSRAPSPDCRFVPDYLTVVDGVSFEQRDELTERSLIVTAARIGTTRLIDNLWLTAQPASATEESETTA